MKADLYIQDIYRATIELPGDGLLALLARGMITHAQRQAALLQQELNAIPGVSCQISLRYTEPVVYDPATHPLPPGEQAP